MHKRAGAQKQQQQRKKSISAENGKFNIKFRWIDFVNYSNVSFSLLLRLLFGIVFSPISLLVGLRQDAHRTAIALIDTEYTHTACNYDYVCLLNATNNAHCV